MQIKIKPSTFLFILGFVLVVLKLTGVIDWPWWVVTILFWWFIPVVAVVLVLYLLFEFIVNLTHRK